MDREAKLFHYTGAGALLSIITKRQLWASVAEFMNDRNEGTLVSRAIEHICNQPETFLPEMRQPNRKLLEALRWSLGSGRSVAVASFSSHGRSLPMYRMYTPPAGGFALSFPKRILQTIGTLVEVDYSDKALWQWAREYAMAYMAAAATIETSASTALQINNQLINSTDLIRQRVIAGLMFKSDEFINEAESRVMFMGDATHYRESREGNYIIPYRIINLPNDNFEVHLTCGPNRDPRLAQETTAQAIRAAMKAGTKWAFVQGSTAEFGFRT